jgi:hypothetical protein
MSPCLNENENENVMGIVKTLKTDSALWVSDRNESEHEYRECVLKK